MTTYLTLLDLILILVVFGFAFYGLFFGFIQSIGSVVGLFAAAWLASRYVTALSPVFDPIVPGGLGGAETVAFIVIFVVVTKLVGIIFWAITKAFKLIYLIPFTKLADRILGLLLGLFEGVVIVGVSLFYVHQSALSPWFDAIMTGSFFAMWFLEVGRIVLPLVPAFYQWLTQRTYAV